MSETNGSDENDISLILARAGCLDVQTAKFADKLHQDRSIYYIYSSLDALNIFYSIDKYYVDLFIGRNGNELHDFLTSPIGLVSLVAGSVALASFSMLATYFEGLNLNQQDKRNKFAKSWGYFRDMSKALKNAYKGWRSVEFALLVLSVIDVRYLLLPLALGLGLLAVVNRFILRSLINDRKIKMEENAKLVTKIKKLSFLTEQDFELYCKQIAFQTTRERWLAFFSAGIGGVIDGSYLYLGALSLANLAPKLFIASAAICVFYTVTCVLMRFYEEHIFQQRLIATQLKCELILIARLLESTHAQLLIHRTNALDREQALLLEEKVRQLIDRFEVKYQLLQRQTANSYFNAILAGVNNGLYAYGMISNVLFFLSTILTLSSTAFPPLLIIISVSLGLGLILGCVLDKVRKNYHAIQQEKKDDLCSLKQIKEDLSISSEEMDKTIKKALPAPIEKKSFLPEWVEAFRSLFSGAGKGLKFISFAAIATQEKGGDGQYHDRSSVTILGIISACVFGLSFFFRAMARGWRKPLGQIELRSDWAKTEVPVGIAKQPIVQTDVPSLTKMKAITYEMNNVEKNSLNTKKRGQSFFPHLPFGKKMGNFAEDAPKKRGLDSKQSSFLFWQREKTVTEYIPLQTFNPVRQG